ncbi:MAG: cell division protein ZapE [Alphaproteobacteria bacterium]
MTPVEALDALIASGEMRPDPAQRAAVEKLTELAARLDGYKPTPKSKGGGFLKRIGFGGGAKGAEMERPPEGLYIWGPVGRGKSMLMDLFFDHVQVQRKRRVHFHAFMQDVQKLAHARRKSGLDGDPIPAIAAEVAETAWLLCFDEFQVDNIADAMTLGRLFESLFQAGVVVVSTSNAAPTELYKDGLQRDRFLPFLDLFASYVQTYELDGGADYRLDRLKGQSVYHVPHNGEAEAALARAFADLTDDATPLPVELTVRGRTVEAPRAAKGVAWFTFEELCKRPLGPADYLVLAEAFHTFIIAGIPVLGPDDRNEARRLVTCIDACYEHKVNVICSADAAPDELYVKGVGDFEFRRCASRLVEMQAEDYVRTPHIHAVD